jgi:hypothetical protein
MPVQACKGIALPFYLLKLLTTILSIPCNHPDEIMLYGFFWVIPLRLNFICRRLGTLCLFHLHRWLSAYEDGTDSFEMLAYKIHTPGITQNKTYNIQNTVKV